MQLRSAVAVAVAGCYSSDSTPSLETSICHSFGPKKEQKKGGGGGEQNKNAMLITSLGNYLHYLLKLNIYLLYDPVNSCSHEYVTKLCLYAYKKDELDNFDLSNLT